MSIMPAERWLCPSCAAMSAPSPETPSRCSHCDAPLQVGAFGLLAEVGPERSARVYRGREAAAPAAVTVRIFPEAFLPSLPLIRRAVEQASSFTHPMIAKPLDAGTHRNRVYVVESFVPGDPITQTHLTLREAVQVIRNVASTLDLAHRRGIVHPDLQAEVLWVSRDSGQSLGESGGRVSLTGFGGASGGSVRANVRALGAILYGAVTGKASRESASWPPVSPSSLNPQVDSTLESIILMAMELDSSRRPRSAAHIASELTQWIEGGRRPGAVPERGQLPRPSAWLKVRSIPRTAATLCVAGLTALVLLMTRKGDPPPLPIPTASASQARVQGPPPLELLPSPSSAALAEVGAPVAAPPPSLPEREQTPELKGGPSLDPSHPSAHAAEPSPPAADRVEPAKPAPDPAPPPNVGGVRAVHLDFGVFVTLESANKPALGDSLEALRNGHVVAQLGVERITAPDRRYSNGCAVCRIVSGETSPGDTVRRIVK